MGEFGFAAAVIGTARLDRMAPSGSRKPSTMAPVLQVPQQMPNEVAYIRSLPPPTVARESSPLANRFGPGYHRGWQWAPNQLCIRGRDRIDALFFGHAFRSAASELRCERYLRP